MQLSITAARKSPKRKLNGTAGFSTGSKPTIVSTTIRSCAEAPRPSAFLPFRLYKPVNSFSA
ncbi:hypothetical protein HanIR_Chr04g0182481 [Helianthus annuus]|nr:hypothetical protein HanIR_Chr04g0182481 [Helianthus annuus]